MLLMRLAELSRQTGVSTATLKYYLREELLHPGMQESRTQAAYDASHVDRVRLVRALVESGGLSLARAKTVIDALDHPPESRHELLGVAQAALAVPGPAEVEPDWTRAAEDFVRARGWDIQEGDPLVPALGSQLRALVQSGIGLGDGSTLDAWADAADAIAEADLATLPDAPGEAIRQVVAGTVLTDPILQTLRRLAQQHRSASLFKD